MTRMAEHSNGGQELTGPAKHVTLARLRAFSGGPLDAPQWPIRNIHTEPDYARAAGLETAGAAGVQYEGYLIDLMIEAFGPDWLESGALTDVRFTAPVPVGSVIYAKATIVDKSPSADGTRLTLSVSCVDEQNNAVLVGTATAVEKNRGIPA